MLGLGLSLLTGGSLRPYYAVVAAAFKDRVEADGGTVESMSCLKADLKVLNPIKPPAYTGLLNDYSGAAAAYSLRLLDNTYTGNAIKVRRASDNAEQDIAFANNELDTATLETFASGTDAFVTTWYDQSGNGNDAAQGTASSQPKIVSSGSTILENGKPSLQFTSASGGNALTTPLNFADNQNIFIVSREDGTASFPIIISTSSGTHRTLILHSSENKFYQYYDGSSTWQAPLNSSTRNTRYLHYTEKDNTRTDIPFYQNGSLLNNTSILRPNAGTGLIQLGRQESSSFPLSGIMQEVIFYTNSQSDNVSDIETNINDFYSIY